MRSQRLGHDWATELNWVLKNDAFFHLYLAWSSCICFIIKFCWGESNESPFHFIVFECLRGLSVYKQLNANRWFVDKY